MGQALASPVQALHRLGMLLNGGGLLQALRRLLRVRLHTQGVVGGLPQAVRRGAAQH